MRQFISEVILSNNFMAQFLCLILAFLILGFMIKTKPKLSKLFSVLLICNISSIITIMLQLFLPVIAVIFGKENEIWIKIYCAAFYVGYAVILNAIFIYMHMLTHGNIRAFQKRVAVVIIFDAIYALCCFLALMKPDFISVTASGVIFDSSAYRYLIFGSIDAYICLINALINRKTLPRIIFIYSIIFTILDIAVLNLQLIIKDVLFFEITYVIPVIIFYILFHSNPIDENSGIRNELSFENVFHNMIKTGKKFILIDIYFPFLTNEAVQNTEEFNMIIAKTCREIEMIDNSIEIYSRNRYSYIILIDRKPKESIENIVIQIQNIMQRYTNINYIKLAMTNKMTVVEKSEHIDTIKKYNNYIEYIKSRYFKDNADNEYHISNEKDFTGFAEYYKVYETLFDIRNTGNLDDERVICYAQPIYEVASEKFKTAEALMRMKIDGKIIYPDVFIPIAENNNFIHILTCIIVNKVCKEIKKLEENFEFDAITINSSTIEFDDTNFNEEILDIIHKNGVESSKIRLEITESNKVDTYKNIKYNMFKMRESGIVCYLDDFGTGYSNLERIFGCPFNTIKFDKSIFYKSMEDPAMDEIMTSTINAFKNKGFSVLVEGIEDEKQKEICVSKGFEYIQGYFYSRPVPIEQLSDFFEDKMPVN